MWRRSGVNEAPVGPASVRMVIDRQSPKVKRTCRMRRKLCATVVFAIARGPAEGARLRRVHRTT